MCWEGTAIGSEEPRAWMFAGRVGTGEQWAELKNWGLFGSSVPGRARGLHKKDSSIANDPSS